MHRPTRAGPGPQLRLLTVLPTLSRPLTAVLLATAVGAACLTTAFVVTTGRMLGAVAPAVSGGAGSAAADRLIGLAVVVAALFAARQALAPVQRAVAEILGRRADEYVQRSAMVATLGADTLDNLETDDVRDRLALVRGVGPAQHTAASALIGLTNIVTRVLQVLGLLALIAWYVWWLALLLGLTLVLLRPGEVRRAVRSVQVMVGRATLLRRSAYLRSLCMERPAAKEVRLYGLTAWIGREYLTAWRAALQVVWRERRGDEIRGVFTALATVAVYGLAFGVSAWLAANGTVSVATLAVLAQATIGSADFLLAGEDEGRAEFGSLGLGAVATLQPAAPRASRAAPLAPGAPGHSIVVESLRFTYPGRDRPVFEALDLEIPAGRSIAVVGLNGAGKTTLVKLLTGLYRPDGGRVLVDGVDLATVDPATWRSRLAVVFQDFGRYELSVAANVSMAFGETVEPARLDKAAVTAGAAPAIDRLPDGWGTVLSPEYADGVDLSGGEWQRLALARALYAVDRGAGLLILDEPTANMDPRAEVELFDDVLASVAGVTTVLISHRFSTVRRADLIVVLDEGRVLERGSHDELMARDGRYAHLFRLQAAHIQAPVKGG